MKDSHTKKYNKYFKLMLELRKIYNIKKSRLIPVIFNIYGIIFEETKQELNRINIKLDYNKLMIEILLKEENIIIKQNNKID